MKKLFVRSEEKLLRALDKKTKVANLAHRLSVPETDRLLSKKTRRGFLLTTQKKNRFALYGTILRAERLRAGEYRIRFTRPLVSGAAVLLLSLFLLAAGLSVLFSEFFFSLLFLLPAIPLVLSLFFFSEKTKKHLLKAAASLGLKPKE